MRSLMALGALSLLVGYLSFRSWWARAAVGLLCLPYAFAGNVVRIFAVIVMAAWRGQTAGETTHDVMGFGVFIIVLGLVQLTVGLMQHAKFDAPLPSSGPKPAGGPDETSAASRAVWLPAGLGAAAAGVVIFAANQVDAIPLDPRVGVNLAADGVNPVPLPNYLGTD
jgi:exosortase/archaeosortase family protein